MKKQIVFLLFILACSINVQAQAEDEIISKLKEIAIIEKKVMIPMRDGVRLSTNVYRPKTDAKVPVIFVRTPYNFNSWVNGERRTRTARAAYEAVKRGYAYVKQNERGRYFSEGEWQILGAPITDASDMYKWLRAQSWSNGKIGLSGCSSTAEWQLGAASVSNAADAMVPMGYGAGVGVIKNENWEYYEQGNWFRGGAHQMLFDGWLYSVEQDKFGPQIPEGATQEDLIRIARFYDLGPDNPSVDWDKAYWHLPIQDVLKNVGGKKEIFDNLIRRKPNSEAWFSGGLYNSSMDFNVPSFWFVSWYDVSDAVNLALYNHVRKNSDDPIVRNNQYLVIAPTPHCTYEGSENTIVGERNMGDARLNYDEQIWDWFDFQLKGEKNDFIENTPRVQYYTMGSNEWQASETWPPQSSQMTTFYLDSDGNANSLYGDGTLSTNKPEGQGNPDEFIFNPAYPLPTHGGGFCCQGISANPGALDQHQQQTRNDILVYTTEPLEEGVEITGFIRATIYVGSNVKDTDFTLRITDVYPDGTAYNVSSTIMRTRYREGFDKEIFMENGEVYKLKLPPMATSNYFKEGHRIRIEISSSNFPRYARNLNTGGNNYDETEWVVANSKVFHSTEYPSQIKLPIKK